MVGTTEAEGGKATRLPSLKQHWWAIGIIALLSLGAFGAGLKYLDESAKREKAANAGQSDFQKSAPLLSKVNPFVEAPLPTSTPQLSKEYLYAGSKLLAVEDANASAAPPADLAVWRPSTGYWYVLGGTGSQATSYPWGANGDKAVPGDYDGDGKTDFSVFRPGSGTWYIVRSSDGTSFAYAFGLSGDVAVPADYDGYGKTDAAIYRPSTGYWYIQRSSDGVVTGRSFGIATDVPAPADYDGDGKADLAFWRATDYNFSLIRSSDNQPQNQAFYAAVPGDQPVSADYDGDGKADFAMRHGSDWLIRYSATAYATASEATTVPWQAGDFAVQNDYDGDGKVDVAVWRSGDGHWLIRQSSQLAVGGGLRDVQWGLSGDTPVPAFYRR